MKTFARRKLLAKTPRTLTVIDPASKRDRLAPPASLGKAGAELWRNLLNDYVIEDSAGCQMLLRICETADTIAEHDEEVGRDGCRD